MKVYSKRICGSSQGNNSQQGEMGQDSSLGYDEFIMTIIKYNYSRYFWYIMFNELE
jgi:hypothetical protein